MSSTVMCEACSEENKSGSTRCAQCGVALKVVEGAEIDPELTAFNVAATALVEKNRQEHREWLLRDIATTGGLLFPDEGTRSTT